MAINDNQNTRFIFVRSTKEKIPCTEQQFQDFYRMAGAVRKKEQYAFNSNGNKGIACGLNNLQLIRVGEPLGGKTSAENDFASDNDDDFLN